MLNMQTQQLQLTEEALQASKEQAHAQAVLLQKQLSSTPSPNQNTPSPERPQDVAYKNALETQAAAEPPLTDHTNAEQKQLIQFVGEIVKAIDTITGIHIIMLGYTYISQQYYRVP